MVPPVTLGAITVIAIYIITVRDCPTEAAGLGLAHVLGDPEGVAQLGHRLAGLEHVRPGQVEHLVGDPDTSGAPPHPEVVLAGTFSSRILPITYPDRNGLNKTVKYLESSTSQKS